MWRQFPYSYYRNKYIYELIYSRYENRKVDKISIEEIKQIIGILNKEYPEGYKFIDSNKPAREAGKNHTDEISEIGKLEDEREFLKEAIREYKKKKKIFESSGGLR
jgi:hypothetical protein